MTDNKDKDKNKIIIDSVQTDDGYKLGRQYLTENIKKSINDYRPNEEEKKKRKYKGTKVVFTSRYNTNTQFGDSLSKEGKRLSDKELKDLVSIDPYIAAIINTRVSQATSLGDRSASKFDKGVRIVDTQRLDRDDFDSDESYEMALKVREAEKEAIMRWILSCGTSDKDVMHEIYKGADPTFKFCSLKDYFQAQTRNLLTFGRCARQNLRAKDGTIVAFRPVPVETIKPVKPYEPVHIANSNTATSFQSIEDVKDYNKTPEFDRPISFVQEIDGFQANFFTDKDLVMQHYQTQALTDLNGYPLAPIEFALFLVYINQHCLSYLRNQFVKGVLTKSMLVLTSTDPSVQISQEDLATFKAELQNYASRTDNSAATPVLAGPIQVNNVRLNDNMKDMEWPTLSNMIVRALCSAFQISPLEAGFGQLGDSAGLSSGNKDYDLVQGEERGLRILADILIQDINDAVFDNFPQAREKYKIELNGIGNETREGVLARQVQEMQTTATMNDLLAEGDKNRLLSVGGEVPLSPVFHSSVAKYMKYGVFMEHFFGEKGASERQEYDFLIDPSLNQAYQAAKLQTQEMAAKSQELQLMQQQQAMAMQEQQMQLQAAQAEQQANQPQQEQQPELEKSEDDRSLLEALLGKSESMLKSWNNAQETLLAEAVDNKEE